MVGLYSNIFRELVTCKFTVGRVISGLQENKESCEF